MSATLTLGGPRPARTAIVGSLASTQAIDRFIGAYRRALSSHLGEKHATVRELRIRKRRVVAEASEPPSAESTPEGTDISDTSDTIVSIDRIDTIELVDDELEADFGETDETDETDDAEEAA